MTFPYLADATYVEPSTPEIVAKSSAKERPDAVLPTMGGQTALNTALSLFNDGTLEKYGVEMIGADAEAIDKAEDRIKFRDAMDKIGLERSEEHTSELQSLMRISYAVFCLQNKNRTLPNQLRPLITSATKSDPCITTSS